MIRSLSQTEVVSALTCQAQHAFSYTGHLTKGRCLRSKQIAPSLSYGRAWGRAVAIWHSHTGSELEARLAAHEALQDALERDVAEQLGTGAMIAPEVEVAALERLGAVLDHYTTIGERMVGLRALEEHILLPIPARTGKRTSSVYRYECYLDGAVDDEHGREWLVEFKYHGRLTPLRIVERLIQLRWEAWARQHQTGRPVQGVIFDERLAEAPKPPRLVKDKKRKGVTVSHAKEQLCTADDYRAVCAEYGVDPKPETELYLEGRVWQQRPPILFRPDEIEQAGKELVDAAQLIRDLDGGRQPIRNGQQRLCNSCRFDPICSDPDDELALEANYELVVPKRLRGSYEIVPALSRGEAVYAQPFTFWSDDYKGERSEEDDSQMVRS